MRVISRNICKCWIKYDKGNFNMKLKRKKQKSLGVRKGMGN